MTNISELKPCPHPFKRHTLKSIEITREPRDYGGNWWHVRCRECGLETPADETEKGAIARWNKAPRGKNND